MELVIDLRRAVLAAAIGLLVAAAILALGASSADAAKTGPKGAAFYEPPSDLPKGHGKLIWKRGAGSVVKLEGAAYSTKVLYTSKSPQREQIAVSGVVSVPEGEPPKGGWPIISYAHGTTGVADKCAPSGMSAKNPALPFVTYAYPELEDWIAAGYAVLATDYPGLGTPGRHPYLIGKSEGRGVLDIVRAGRQLDRDLGDKFLIAGHSQGGQSALFAARYAEQWVSELELRGTASYAPASHVSEQEQAISGLTTPGGLTALAVTIVYGATTANPLVTAEDILKPEPLALFPQLDERCLPQLSTPKLYGGIAPADLEQPGQPSAAFAKVLGKMNPAIETSAPILLSQGLADTTVFPAFTDLLDGELKALGNDVEYNTYPGVTHSEILAAAEDTALPWMQGRLPTG